MLINYVLFHFFQIKIILPPKRLFVVVAGVYIALTFSEAPVYVVNRLDMVFSPGRNKTILAMVSAPDKDDVEKVSFAVNSFILPLTAYVIVIVCTIILVFSLRKRTKWRNLSAVTSQSDANIRSQRVSKMVVMISTLFISCFVPMSICLFIIGLEPELNIYGKYMNVGMIIAGISILLECINSSSNIFIYYHMSIKYRDAFNSIICK